jgi:fibronectin type 3 domain-containing protein
MVSGTVSATFTLTSSASPATTTQGLTGTGTAAATHSVALSWNASTSSGIVGYNVYRAPYTTSCGSFAKVNSVLNTGMLYTDFGVANGNHYCYATTAVDSSSQESGYSNIVSNVQIPAL